MKIKPVGERFGASLEMAQGAASRAAPSHWQGLDVSLVALSPPHPAGSGLGKTEKWPRLENACPLFVSG